jgi:hypothetical protein
VGRSRPSGGFVFLAGIAAVAAALVGPGAGAIPSGTVVSENPADWTPHVLGGRVAAIVQVGNRMVVGGNFTRVRDPGRGELSRRNLFAFDATTGAIDRGFAPDPDGKVEALATDGTSVFAGGLFNRIGGGPAAKLAKLDPRSGRQVPGFRAGTNAAVRDLALKGGRLFLSGEFMSLNGAGRSGLGAVDPATGALSGDVNVRFSDPRGPHLFVNKIAVSPDGSRLVALGSFTRVDGQERHQLAVLDVGSRPARVANWQTDVYAINCEPSYPSYMRDVDISPDGSWFAVVTTGARAKPTYCDTAIRFELGASGLHLRPTWVAYTGGDSLISVAATDAAVYIGGHPRWMNNYFNNDTGLTATPGPGAVPRPGIAALDTENGLPLSWNPGREPRGVGVFAFLATPAGLWVGSDTDNIGREHHPRLAFLPAAGGKRIPPAFPGSLPGVLYALAPGSSRDLVGQSFDGQSAGAPDDAGGGVDWSRARGAFMLSGKLYSGWDDGHLEVRTLQGNAFGPPRTVDLHGLNSSHFPVAGVTGMFFDRGRLYYTLAGRNRLYYRHFSPESEVVGAQTFEADKAVGVNWGDVRGLTLASGRLYYGRSDGSFHRIEFRGGRPVPGTGSAVGTGGRSWRSQGLFVLAR